jgi:hypothetical protein
LLEREVLDAEEVRMVMQGIPLKERGASEPSVEEKTLDKSGAESEERKPLRPPLPALNNPKAAPQG